MTVYTPVCIGCMSSRCEHVSISLSSSRCRLPKRLSPRQVQIVRLVGEGLRNKEIACRLSVCEGYVKATLVRIFDVLSVTSRLEVGLWAQKHADLLTGHETRSSTPAGPLEKAGDIPFLLQEGGVYLKPGGVSSAS